ncbi:MAG: gamma-glutamyltransferase [Hyphomicrobiaceae bacterium]
MRSYHLPGRSPVIARHGMAATSHPAASLVAIETLKRGGNAVDAAIAATALLCVIEPAMTGIGGDCFALLHKPGKGLVALNASGRAPDAATPERFARLGVKEITVTSPHAVTVPGSIDGWDRLLRDYGTMSFAQVLGPAIEAAEGGFAVAPRVATDWASLVDKIKLNDGARQHLLFGGAAPRVGDVIRMPALAATLKILARDGRDAFYEGPIADDIVATLNSLGGVHASSDFKRQQSSYVTPISVGYKGVDLYELPPNNQGIVALIVLKMLERLGMADLDAGSAERYHIMLEAARLAYAARDAFVADPETMNVPISFMLSDGFIDDLTRRIDRSKRRTDLGPMPRPGGTDTIYLTVVDKDGMAVSFINSLFAGFGSGIVTAKTGITLQNRGSGFVLDAKHPNAIGPRKRPLHTLVPAMAMKNGAPWMSFGVMGGMLQPVGHVYVLANMVDYGMDVQEAIDHPRVFFDGAKVQVEEGVPAAVRAQLTGIGHDVSVRPEPWGGAQAIVIDQARGVLIGGSDGRKDGVALGY